MNQSSFSFVRSDEPPSSPTRSALDHAWCKDEAAHVRELLDAVPLDTKARQAIDQQAQALVVKVRKRAEHQGAMEAFMQEYDLSSEEGVVLMCLAEALLRIPDTDTAEKLISDKLGDADWQSHLGKSESLFVNASTWGLMLTGRLVQVGQSARRDFNAVLGKLANRSGEPFVRLAIRQAMKIMGHQYVMGKTIRSALDRADKKDHRRFRYSFDMLGEAALTDADAQRYKQAYADAIDAIGKSHRGQDIFDAPSISVKLSALHARYEPSQRNRVLDELVPILLELALKARDAGIALTVDAEEAERLMLSLDVFTAVLADEQLRGWDGLGLALQAYQKRAWAAIDWLAEHARSSGHRIPIRLVKGAYWDTEIKLAQMDGHAGYPVFTRKPNTDTSYLACAARLLAAGDAFYPQFATHNAHTICAINAMAQRESGRIEFEYQRLHGMGQELYEAVLEDDQFNGHCRVYAPVGRHEDLLPYLVRRLLENGANTSFVNRILDEDLAVEEVVSDPISQVNGYEQLAHPQIPLPVNLYGDARRNSSGINFAVEHEQTRLIQAMQPFADKQWSAQNQYASATGDAHAIRSPANHEDQVGRLHWASPGSVDEAVNRGFAIWPDWDSTPAIDRADCLDSMAELIEQHRGELMALCVREAGKTLEDGIAEVREAADFCRYYAAQARADFSTPLSLPGPTGERNELSLHGRGVFVCISPWNFPLAIFVGQVAAALAAGNAVIAKPAEQTPMIAVRAVELLHQAGIPADVLQLLPGDGEVGAALTQHPHVAGVAFTGSTETARLINRSLAAREGPIGVLIAETGGQNAMLVDSSALAEQVVRDVIQSAFLSAGQRCSALRVLYLQRDIADHVMTMLAGAMHKLKIGWPGQWSTDIGPVIDANQQALLEAHIDRLQGIGREIARVPMPNDLPTGYWFAPAAFEIDSIEQLDGEVFGPILHVVRYSSKQLDQVIDSINATGFGLTMGVHSRIERSQKYIADRIRVGNAYINRNMTGAVVGVQPFGGEGLSGTGPKAGGPHYLPRFAVERTRTINTAAVGGNASLMVLSD